MTDTAQDMKFQMIRECEAMLAYISGRGIQKDLPDDGSMAMFDLDLEGRMATPMAQVMTLHQSLARLVAPAFPETIERLHTHQLRANDGGWDIWRRVAPLSSVFWLLVVTVAIAGLLTYLMLAEAPLGRADLKMQPVFEHLRSECRTQSQVQETQAQLLAEQTGAGQAATGQVLSERIKVACNQKRQAVLFRLFLLFGLIGALGAAYSSIYDSFSYIRDGTYDMRLASTYYVRIFLGVFSGILLAEPLGAYLDQGAFSSTLLAFMGGFGAQLVYDLLTKLVDSVANMFRPERRKERMDTLKQAELAARQAIIEEDAAKRQTLAQIIEEAQAIEDPEARAAAMQKAILQMMTGETEPAGVSGGAAVTDTAAIADLLELSRCLLALLPDPPDAGRLEEIDAALNDLRRPDLPDAEKARALATARRQDPVPGVIAGAIPGLLGVASRKDAQTLARAATLAAAEFDAAQRLRWHRAAYRAMPDDPMQLVAGAGASDLAAGGGAIGAALTARLGDAMSAGRIAALNKQGVEALWSEVQSGFDDRAAFDAALPVWAGAVADRLLLEDIRSRLTPRMPDAPGAETLVTLLGAVSNDAAASGSLQTFELIGGCIPQCGAPERARVAVLGAIRAQFEKAGS